MDKADFSSMTIWLERPIFIIGHTEVTAAHILLAVLVLCATFWATRISRLVFARLSMDVDESHKASLRVLQRFMHYLIVIVGGILVLSTLGVDMTHLAMIATALSVGIGMGMQSIFNNLFSGLIILLERSLKAGDYIELGADLTGTVIEIRIRSTLVRTNDNMDVVIPNSEFVSTRVTNWTMNDSMRRLRIPFGVAYGTDKELVRKAVLEAASRVPTTLHGDNHDPDVWLTGFGDSSLNFVLVVWTDMHKNNHPRSLVSSYLWEIETSLREYNIEIPFPQRDIRIRSNGTEGK